MRTRRSPRNQEMLWRALGNVQQPVKHAERLYTDAEIEALSITKRAKAAMRREMRGRRMRAALKPR